MIRLHTLGRLGLTDGAGQPIRSLIQQPRRLALLTYLAVARTDRWYRRDSLVATFWPDADAERARASLSQALYQLRRTLGSEIVLSRGTEEVGLSDDLWCDAVEFAAALRDGKPEDALVLYRGPFLDGFFISDASGFEQWVDEQREFLRRAAVDALGTAADSESRRGTKDRALDFARRALAAAPTDEAALRRLVSILARFGDRTGALEAYESFVAKLRADYELEPSDATKGLIDSIRSQTRPIDSTASPKWTEAPHAEAASPSDTSPPIATRGARPRRWPILVAVVLLLTVGLSAYFGRRALIGAAHEGGGAGETLADATPSIAVLPFLNLNAAGGSDYFSDGLAEQLISALARVSNLRVAARTSAFTFKNSHASLHDIGRALGVRYVVEASVRQDDKRLRIAARLVDAGRPDSPLLWSATYDRTLNDIFAIQEELSTAIASAIEHRLVPQQALGIVRPTANVEAYNEFLKGRFHFNTRSPDHAMEGIQAFERAIALDSNFAAAWSGLADAYALLPYYALAAGRDVLPKAQAAAHRAVALDSMLAEPHTTLGWIAYTYEWDWASAEREFQTSLRLNPNYPDGLHFYSLFLSRVIGDRARARDVAERAQLVDPLAPVAYGGAGAVFYHTRDYERSIAAHLHGLALDSTYWVSRGLLAKTYLAAGRPRDALKELRIIPPPFGGIHGGPAIVGTAFAQLGMIDSARAMLATALRQPTKSYDLAILYTALHDNDAAFAALDRAMAERDPFVVCLRNDPLLDALKGDARFERVARMMKLPAVPANDPR